MKITACHDTAEIKAFFRAVAGVYSHSGASPDKFRRVTHLQQLLGCC